MGFSQKIMKLPFFDTRSSPAPADPEKSEPRRRSSTISSQVSKAVTDELKKFRDEYQKKQQRKQPKFSADFVETASHDNNDSDDGSRNSDSPARSVSARRRESGGGSSSSSSSSSRTMKRLSAEKTDNISPSRSRDAQSFEPRRIEKTTDLESFDVATKQETLTKLTSTSCSHLQRNKLTLHVGGKLPSPVPSPKHKHQDLSDDEEEEENEESETGVASEERLEEGNEQRGGGEKGNNDNRNETSERAQGHQIEGLLSDSSALKSDSQLHSNALSSLSSASSPAVEASFSSSSSASTHSSSAPSSASPSAVTTPSSGLTESQSLEEAKERHASATSSAQTSPALSALSETPSLSSSPAPLSLSASQTPATTADTTDADKKQQDNDENNEEDAMTSKNIKETITVLDEDDATKPVPIATETKTLRTLQFVRPRSTIETISYGNVVAANFSASIAASSSTSTTTTPSPTSPLAVSSSSTSSPTSPLASPPVFAAGDGLLARPLEVKDAYTDDTTDKDDNMNESSDGGSEPTTPVGSSVGYNADTEESSEESARRKQQQQQRKSLGSSRSDLTDSEINDAVLNVMDEINDDSASDGSGSSGWNRVSAVQSPVLQGTSSPMFIKRGSVSTLKLANWASRDNLGVSTARGSSKDNVFIGNARTNPSNASNATTPPHPSDHEQDPYNDPSLLSQFSPPSASLLAAGFPASSSSSSPPAGSGSSSSSVSLLSTTIKGTRGPDDGLNGILSPRSPVPDVADIAPTVSSALSPEDLKKMEMKRNDVIEELLQTERDFVDNLNVLINVFMQPIRELNLLNNHQISSLFVNVELLRPVNVELLAELEAVKGGKSHRSVGYFFTEKGDLFKLYAIYCSQQPFIHDRLTLYKSENEELTNFLKKTFRRPECRKLDIEAFLIMPLQRICKYPLLLQELLKHTPSDHQEYGVLMDGFVKIKDIVDRVNEHVRRVENRNQLSKAAEKIKDFDATSDMNRVLVHEGTIKVAGKETIAFLFSDGLVLCNPSKKPGLKHKFSRMVNLSQAVLNNIEDQEGEGLQNRFELVEHGAKPMVLQVEKVTGKRIWIKHLKATIEKASNLQQQQQQQAAQNSLSPLPVHSNRNGRHSADPSHSSQTQESPASNSSSSHGSASPSSTSVDPRGRVILDGPAPLTNSSETPSSPSVAPVSAAVPAPHKLKRERFLPFIKGANTLPKDNQKNDDGSPATSAEDANKMQGLEKKVSSLQESVTKLSKQLGRETTQRKREEAKVVALKQELDEQKAKTDVLHKEQSKIIEQQQQQIIQQQSVIASLKHTIGQLEATHPQTPSSSSSSPSAPGSTEGHSSGESIASWKEENETLLKSLYSAINLLTHENIGLTNQIEALNKRLQSSSSSSPSGAALDHSEESGSTSEDTGLLPSGSSSTI